MNIHIFHFGAVVVEALRIPLPSLLSLPVCTTMLDFLYDCAFLGAL